MVYYTIYNKKEEVVAFGNARQCAAMLRMSDATFKSVISKVKHGKNKKYVIVREEGETDA